MSDSSPASFTGRGRRRSTRRSVLLADRLARTLISIGGVGTILAVSGVCLFLVWVVVPLFLPAGLDAVERRDRPGAGQLLHLGVDEYRLLGWTLHASGRIDLFRVADGAHRATLDPFADGVTAAAVSDHGDLVAVGMADGGVQLAEVGFTTSVRDAADLPAELVATLQAAARAGSGAGLLPQPLGDGLVEPTGGGQFRHQELRVELGERLDLGEAPVVRVDHVVRGSAPFLVALTGGPAPALWAVAGRSQANFLTGERTVELAAPVRLPITLDAADLPRYLVVSGPGEDLYLGWESGRLDRVDLRDLGDAYLAESGRLVPEGARLTALERVLGGLTLVWGDSRGAVAAGFPVRLADLSPEIDLGAVGLGGARRAERSPVVLVRAKELATAGDAAVTALTASSRTRLAMAGFADGSVRLWNVTNASQLLSRRLVPDEAVVALAIAPKEDGLVAATPRHLVTADLDARFPETSFQALFRPVWYEGYGEPLHTWQSSSASDDFEIKLGLMPLIFGTVKATVYSMLFGAPLALLAAIFTSEFLGPRPKAAIKPAIELMASLPSVVLGFLAALVFAPYVEQVLPAILALAVTLPATFLLGAHAWQLLPHGFTLRLDAWRFAFVAAALPVGIAAAFQLGPRVEEWFFGGDLRAWLSWAPTVGADPRFAPSVGGWMFVTLPMAALAVAVAGSRWGSPLLRHHGRDWSRRRFATIDLGRFALGAALAVVLAFALAFLLDAVGLDPRGGFVDTYVQRNALIVGFMMGFAIIPIIYTISEDALSTVPEHLRSASLGAGATRWQTAVRIVVPTAMSGLFSALMVGLGRAVGETMIVLMAAGNTPVMEWNVFEGFRTLSANIAVELPEAVRNSGHYRTLFLAALVLFLLTFLVNTAAEIIRLRFRKRAYQL